MRSWRVRGGKDRPLLSEMVAAYRQIGLEVHLQAFDPDQEPGCAVCMASMPEKYKTIYTRKRPGS